MEKINNNKEIIRKKDVQNSKQRRRMQKKRKNQSMIVAPSQKIDILSPHAVVAGKHIRQSNFVYMPQMRWPVRVVDGSGNVKHPFPLHLPLFPIFPVA